MKLIIFLLLSSIASAQESFKILQASAMPYHKGTGKPFGFMNKYYQLSTNGSVADSVDFPADGIYQFNVSCWSTFSRKQWSNLQIQIDGSAVSSAYIIQKVIGIFSLVSSKQISAGKHKVSLALTNHTSLVNVVLKLGLCYISTPGKMILPIITTGIYPDSTKFITTDVWTGGHLRGFDEGTEGNYHPVIEQTYKDLAATGANLIRHHLTIVLNPVTNTYEFQPGDIQRVDSIISWAQKYNYYVNLGFDQDPHSSPQNWWGNQKQETSIAQLWKTIAAKYVNNKFIAVFSPVNEPTPAGRIGEYIQWVQQIIDSVRTVDTNHCIIFPFAHDLGILTMIQPLPWNNVIYEYHMYDPFEVTSQGVNGFIIQNTYPSSTYTKNNLSLKLQPLRDFSAKWNAPICITEFGCVRYAPLNSINQSTADTWLSDCISLFEAEHYAWTAIEWRQSEIWDPELSPYIFYKFPYSYAEPVCNFGSLDIFRSDTTAAMIKFKGYFQLNHGF